MSAETNGKVVTNNTAITETKFTIYVAGEPHVISKLGHRRAKGWRKALQDQMELILPQLGQFEEKNLKVNLENVEQMKRLLLSSFSLIEDALDAAIDLVLAYAGDQLPNKESVLDDMLDEEVVDNFIAVIRAAIPFDHLVRMYRTVAAGREPATTSQSLPSTNGESLTTTA